MWRKLVAFMRFDSFGPGIGKTAKPDPLKRRPPAPSATLVETSATGPNPGNLRFYSFLPPDLKPGAPLVVVLHGCGQTAASYDKGAGWSTLAQRDGFALLAVEQKAVNNPNTCFNWFHPDDIARGSGEVASIAAMVEQAVRDYRLDGARVFITGLSAGGAMTAAMLATYPERFAGGAIIAGLPYGVAANVRDALDAMRSAPLKTPQQWGELVRAAAPAPSRWPRVSIWHGAIDTTVNVNNAQALAAQWADVLGLNLLAAHQDMWDGAVRLSWGDRLEVHTLPLAGHGTPIDGADVGQAGPFILDMGLSSTSRIADFWGLTARAAESAPEAVPQAVAAPQPVPEPMHEPVPEPVFMTVPDIVADVVATFGPGKAASPVHAQALPGFLRRVLGRLKGL